MNASLYLAAFSGGALTLLSPCILPVLPFVLARTGRPFRQGTLPLLLGMALTFAAVASLGAVAGGWAVRFNQFGRAAALFALAISALALLSPRWADRVTRPLVRLGDRLSNHVGRDTGWVGSVLLGVATGLVWSPCAGPILGLILSSAALAGPGVETSSLLLAYAAGASLSLAVALRAGEERFAGLSARLRSSAWPRRVLGSAMLAGVAAVAAGVDTGALARLSLDWSNGLEQRVLQALPMGAAAADTVAGGAKGADGPRGTPSGLPVEPIRPDLSGAVNWLNGQPLDLQQLRGKVVLVNFWTYSCINCLRTLPHVRAWAQTYAGQGLVVIGVHTPEFAFEKETGNVQKALKRLGITYPVAQDNDFAVWRAFQNQYWPALYFIDAEGRVRHHQFGEGGEVRSEQVIQALLREAGADATAAAPVVPDTRGPGLAADLRNVRSPETYLGYRQASGFASPSRIASDRSKVYTLGRLGLNDWGLKGAWTVGPEFVQLDEAGGAVAIRFHARDAHLVLGFAAGHGPIPFQLTLDGRAPGADHGDDVDAEGHGAIDATRLYQLVRQRGSIDDRVVEIRFLDAGARAFAFTFG
ncbi:cytochrome c biogenesis protein DipZ [Variovorax sp. YR216]|uniref:cytochrome c biogenesis protein DipZ n=1 Tax=Variovorax sp. YR216 TaxID=1882828 RepID=UPI000899885A|nr:cytochrome c biogenesis protein DipZ [Variovorax sp. YR216]SEB03652.1 Cytochrome c biogenesis protein CcdA [Variovorax sp. YR216]